MEGSLQQQPVYGMGKLSYRSGHGTVAVLLPGIAINW